MPRLIIGHTTDSSSKIWVRGSARWPVAFITINTIAGARAMYTRTVALLEEEFYTAAITCRRLSPETQYRVKVAFGKSTQTPEDERVREAYTTGTFSTFAENDDVDISFILGSCNLHSLGLFEKPDKSWLRISQLAKSTNAQFMMHCGDQIYSDVPTSAKPSYKHYRDKYLDAWEDCRPAQRVLTELPHYMILDDHEITNNFDNDTSDDSEEALLNVAMKVYYEFQHKHNPDTPENQPRRYYYWFRCGGCEFFVMDTRYNRHSECGEMIDRTQLSALKRWMSRHSDKVKFVVSSVPFVGQVRRPKKDKWCDTEFDRQRESILRHIVAKQIGKLIFLTGDMHNSYHATMEISLGTTTATVHELMSSPINQVTPNTSLGKKYDPDYAGTLGAVSFTSRIDKDSFYGNHSNAMSVKVNGDRVSYSIFRTTKNERGPTGRFDL